MAGLLARFRGGGANRLASDLKKVTESGVIELPKDLVTAVVQCSHNEEDRRTIMQHIRECLAEPSAIRWRRTYAALILVEDLLKNGSQELFDETAEGHHFDLVQRLSLLEVFECTTDKRVQGMIRSKANGMRAEVISRLQTAGESRSVPEANCDRASIGSPGLIGGNTSSSESGGAPWRPEGQMVLNGIVAVGHNDDTTSESSGDEDTRRKAVEFRPVRAKKGAQKLRAKGSRSQDKSDSESSGSDRGRRQVPKAVAPQTSEVDLLQAVAPPTSEVDLLGL